MRRPLLLLAAIFAGLALGASPANPRVLRTHPAQGARRVARDSAIVLRFSQPMDPATLTRETVVVGYTNPELRFFRDPFLDTGYAYDAAARSLIITPKPLLPGQEVEVRVTDGARSAAGLRLKGSGPVRFRLRFRTAPPPPAGG